MKKEFLFEVVVLALGFLACVCIEIILEVILMLITEPGFGIVKQESVLHIACFCVGAIIIAPITEGIVYKHKKKLNKKDD